MSKKYYTPEMAGSGQFGICEKCKLPPTPEGHDGCLGTLPGPIMNACCGHGNDKQAYIQYRSGDTIRGEEAIAEQKRLKPSITKLVGSRLFGCRWLAFTSLGVGYVHNSCLFGAVTYKRCGDVCYLSVFGFRVYRRVGSIRAVFRWVVTR